ncbi:MAG TPA: SAM-dependent methyltransferase [Bradyrhizobium sp.]|nr:SAM-dependent methyltransferase [Bradyrhizobium sp.]
MVHSSSLPASYFEHKYKDDIDPWRFRTSDYERGKYDATIGALAKKRYRHGLEVGCSIGVLTAMLSARCEQLLAIDASPTAIAEARRSALSRVEFRVAAVPGDFPDGIFDLIVLSEVMYYFSANDLNSIAELCVSKLSSEGEIILCHWLGETDYPLTGHQASDLFAAAVATRLPSRKILHDAIYRLERLSARASDASDAG